MLSRIAPVKASNIGRLKVSLYGKPKTGKTRLAVSFPKPLLIIGAEDGTASVAGVKGVDFILLRHTSEFLELVNGPLKGGKYASAVLDTGTKLRDMRVSEIWLERGGPIPDRKPFMYADAAWKEVWTRCSYELKEMLGPFLDLPRQLEINITVIAQEQNFSSDDSGNISSDLIQPAVGSALGKSLCDWLNGECDYIGQTLIREQTVEKEVMIGKVKTKNRVKTGKKEYCLRVGPHEIYYTGFRRAPGLPDLPDFIVDPSYDKIVKQIQG